MLVLTVVVQLVPFTNTANLDSEVEDASKTWAELPVGLAGKERFTWPSEIKYGDFNDWEPEVQEKYPLYGEKDISIFTYVWNPAGALSMSKVNCYIFVQILFIAFGIFAFLIKNSLAKAVVSFIFALSYIYAFVQTLILKSMEVLVPFMPTTVCLLVLGLFAVAIGINYIPEWKREKVENANRKASL